MGIDSSVRPARWVSTHSLQHPVHPLASRSAITGVVQPAIKESPMTTRKSYPGVHSFEALVNGVGFALGSVRLQ